MNAFETLGLGRNATQEEIRQAYHRQVKNCHPDLFSDRDAQLKAQDKMVRLNLAYEEALRLCAQRTASKGVMRNDTLPTGQAIFFAKKHMDKNELESALLQMARAEEKNAEWYCLQGQILMRMKQFSSAQQAFRACVELAPANNEYRAWALKSAVAVKKHQKFPYKLADWAGEVFGKKNRQRTIFTK